MRGEWINMKKARRSHKKHKSETDVRLDGRAVSGRLQGKEDQREGTGEGLAFPLKAPCMSVTDPQGRAE